MLALITQKYLRGIARFTVEWFLRRKQSMVWMEHGLQISLKRFALWMEAKMAA